VTGICSRKPERRRGAAIGGACSTCRCAGPLRERGQLRCWREGPGEALGEGLTPAVEDPGEAVGVDEPGIPVVSESGLEIGGIADQAVAGQFA